MTCLPTCQNAAQVKDVREEMFQSRDFVSGKQKKREVNDFVSEIKRVENYRDFEKLTHVTRDAIQRFIVKNIEGESKEANDLSHIL